MPPSHHYRERDYTFTNTFITLRTTIGLTQAGLATRLGVSRHAVESWEQGLTHPKAESLKAFIALCVRASAFVAGREEEQIRAFWQAAHQKVQLDEYWLSELLNQLSSSPAQPASEQPSAAAQSSTAVSEELALWTVPYARNPHFTGREELLSHLEQQLAPRAVEPSPTLRQAALTQSQAIKGLGGIGKTQTAIEYAYRASAQGRYVHTLWIAAATEEAILASFSALAERLPSVAAGGTGDQRQLVAAVIRWLEQCQEPWLLIYDNADDLPLVQPYLPVKGNGSILLTTRASAVGWLASSLEVETLGVLEGTELLLRRAQRFVGATDEQINEAVNLVLALGQFPLALDQAGAYLEETGCSLADYLQLYQTHQHTLLSRRGRQATGYPAPVATTWALSFQRVEEVNPAAADLLRLCAFLAPDAIPEELLTAGAPHWPPALAEAVADLFTFNQALEALLAFSLVKRLAEERLLSVHRLVQAVQRERLTAEEQRQWAERLVYAVQAVFPREPEEFASWQACQRYLEQAQTCNTLIQEQHLRLPEGADVLDRTGSYLRQRELYSLAEPLLRRALGMREQHLGDAHPDVATSLRNLASLFWNLGEYAQAEPLFQRALRIYEQHPGAAPSDVASVLNSLALLYHDQGNYAQAEPLYLRALGILEQQFGPEHPNIGPLLNNLANVYRAQGKYAQAEPLYQRALHIREQHLGPEHPLVATSLHNLAVLYWKLRKYAQAEPLFQRALLIEVQQRGDAHPSVATSIFNLAALYYDQGRYADTEQLCQQALRIYVQQLRPDHPSVAYPLHLLALVAAKYGKDEESERLDRQALRIWEEQLGAEHPSVAHALRGLALLSARQGRESQAEVLFQRALRLSEQQLGEMHLDTADVLDDFAGFQHVQGRTQEAAIMYQRALITRAHVLGADHPLTRDTRARLQAVLAALGQTQEAAPGEAAPQQEGRTSARNGMPEV